jgi:putative autoinducer-2 (AI-2) aldolase
VPIVIAGGPKVDSEIEVFNFVYDALQNGAIGVNLGRNVWQSQYPVAMISSLRAIIHENHTPNEAHDLFNQIKTGKD